MYLAAGLAGLLLLVVWISRDDDPGPPPPDTKSAQAQVTPSPDDDGNAAVPAPVDAEEDAGAAAEHPAPAVIVDTGAVPDELDASTSGAADSALDGGDPDAGLDASADEAGEAEVSAPSTARGPRPASGGNTASRRKTKPRDKPSEPAPAPATSAKPKPEPSDGAPDAAALLKQAKAAYRAGNGVKAYGLASKSNRAEPSTDALEVMALASCLKGDKDRARDLLKRLPLFNRPGVRSKCKSHGVKLGL
jgi:hypothetical protein